MTAAMEAAKRGRAEQLARWERFMAGEAVEFVDHQGRGEGELVSYDPSVYERPRAPVKVTVDKKTLFHDAALEGDVQLVEKLINEGMDPNDTNPDGLSALHTASIENTLKVVSLLLRTGANVNARDNDWWTPLHAASACGHWRVAQTLLNSGANVAAINADGDMPIDLVESDRLADILKAEMETQGLDEAKVEELRKQPEADFDAYVAAAVEKKADLNERDESGAAMLHVAASNGYMKSVKMLLEAKADVNLPDELERNTPLHLAVFFQNYKTVELLCEHGADLNARNKFDQPPVNLTEDPTMLRLIKAIEAKEKPKNTPIENEHRVDSTLKRKSLKRGQLAKMDSKAESRNAESVYAEIRFTEKNPRPSEMLSHPPKTAKPVVYAELDLQVRKEEEDTSDDDNGPMPVYATPIKKNSADQGPGNAEQPPKPDPSAPPSEPPPNRLNNLAHGQKPESIVTHSNSSSQDTGKKATAEKAASAGNGGGDGGGGCCVVM